MDSCLQRCILKIITSCIGLSKSFLCYVDRTPPNIAKRSIDMTNHMSCIIRSTGPLRSSSMSGPNFAEVYHCSLSPPEVFHFKGKQLQEHLQWKYASVMGVYIHACPYRLWTREWLLRWLNICLYYLCHDDGQSGPIIHGEPAPPLQSRGLDTSVCHP